MGWARRLPYCLGSSTAEEKVEKKRNERADVKRFSMDKKTVAGAVASFPALHARLSRFGKDWVFRDHADFGWKRQGGLFTVHGPPEKSLESVAHERIVVLKQIVIAESYRSKLLAELARYGINSASLFPDLDGLSSYLNWTVESGEFLD